MWWVLPVVRIRVMNSANTLKHFIPTPALGPTQSPYSMRIDGSLGPGHEADQSPPSGLRMNGALPSLPYMPSRRIRDFTFFSKKQNKNAMGGWRSG